ncbi:right-handed parallel beta-helix repeat-containing protein [Niabella hirudinis]|uniref:right-handed parallel beta-helix repeat-containing protein n=1 Tax=Niabella hirudinis TaxID=1285929 RepID=UPI003EB7EEFA
MRRIFQLLLLLLLSLGVKAQKPLVYYVSKKGKDSNPGTLQKPLETLQKARDLIRMQRIGRAAVPVAVYIREGHYFMEQGFELDSSDSGVPEAPVVYSAYRNERVYITGAQTADTRKAVAVTDAGIRARLLPEARSRVLQLDLKGAGISNYGVMHSKGFGHPYSTAAMELFCNQQPMQLARWPNDSLVPTGKVLDPGSIPRNGDSSNRGGIFHYTGSRPGRWTQAKDFWISGFFRYGYADDAVKIKRLDTVAKTLSTLQPTMYGFESGKVFQRWYAFNLLEEIDRPGEYYIDRASGMLYFIPPAGPLRSIELSVTEKPLVTMRGVSNLYFRNITFEVARGIGIYMEGGNNNVVDGCTFRNLGVVGIALGKGTLPFKQPQHSGTAEAASGILGSIYAHLYDNTIFNRDGGTNHRISNCTIYNTGSGGIVLSGGNRVTLQKGNNQVVNCRIFDFNRIERSYKAGINIDGVGNLIRNCEISHCPGSAILLHGNDHIIEYNNIHDAVTDGDDMGAIYYGRDPSEFGNKIRYNFFHHIGNSHGMIMAVYHDDGACGGEVTGNVFYKAGSRTVMIGGGNDNVYRNNIFIDCPLAFHLDNRLMGWAKSFIEKDGLFQKRLEAVNYKKPPYATAYPSLVHYFEDSAGLPKRNFIDGNVFVNVKQLHNGRPGWSYIGKNLELSGDPGFVDMGKMNFELRASSKVFSLLPGFKAIPFGKIGVQKINSSNKK